MKISKKPWLFGLCLLLLLKQQSVVHAAEQLGPLIQTTTLLEEYEGRVYCDATAQEGLAREDKEAAFELAVPSLVMVQNDALLGSGMIWKLSKEQIFIASNRHLLEGFGEEGRVYFANGKEAKAKLLFLSDETDLGFLSVATSDLSPEELLTLKQVNHSKEAYDRLQKDSLIFIAGSADGPGQNRYDARVVHTKWYVEEFDTEMLYCFGYAKPGMSGSGVFDGFGYLVGMLAGGDGGDRTVSIPVEQIEEAFDNAAK